MWHPVFSTWAYESRIIYTFFLLYQSAFEVSDLNDESSEDSDSGSDFDEGASDSSGSGSAQGDGSSGGDWSDQEKAAARSDMKKKAGGVDQSHGKKSGKKRRDESESESEASIDSEEEERRERKKKPVKKRWGVF